MRGTPDKAHSGSSDGVVIAPGVFLPEHLLDFSTARSSGPGGQNVNKLETKVQLRVGVDDLPIPAYARRRLRLLAGSSIIGTRTVVDEQGRIEEIGGELLIVSQEDRSQSRNKQNCLEKLRRLLVEALARPKIRRKTKPTKASKERRLEEKKRRGETKRIRRGGDSA